MSLSLFGGFPDFSLQLDLWSYGMTQVKVFGSLFLLNRSDLVCSSVSNKMFTKSSIVIYERLFGLRHRKIPLLVFGLVVVCSRSSKSYKGLTVGVLA